MKMDEFEMINEDLLQDFTHEILNKYSAFCQKEGITPNFFHLVSFLVKTDVVKEKTVAKYMVMHLYPNSLYSNDSKMDAMMEISIRTGISKKHVYNMVQHPERFGYQIKQKRKDKNETE